MSEGLDSNNEIDLNKHNFIKASAGTGKTHTILELVLKILIEKSDINLSDILIVTYTEKATGELKDRIRSKLKDSIDNRDDLDEKIKDKLMDNLKNFENSNIHTIHGFCSKVIKEYSFETGISFTNTLINDDEVYDKVFLDIKRNVWKEKYKDNLKDLLFLSGYPDYDDSINISKFENTAINIAKVYNDKRDCLLPELDDNIGETIAKLKESLIETLTVIEKEIGRIDKDNLVQSELYQNYKNCQATKLKKDGRLELIILPLLNMILKKNDESILKLYSSYINKIYRDDTIANNGYFNSLARYGKTKDIDEFMEIAGVATIINKFNDLTTEFDVIKLGKFLLVETIRELKHRASVYKRENSLISFQDMLELVNSGLDNEDLKKKLQERYKYGIVDEFQDTDPIQYNIFKKIFMESKDNKLIVVGDPKQAIYGFRGADVYTYLKAEEDFNLSKAISKSLSENYRSSKEMIDSFNEIFKETWFDPDDNNGTGVKITNGNEIKISYENVNFPEERDDSPKLIYRLNSDNPNDKEYSTTIITCDSKTINNETRESYARYIAREIDKLLKKDIGYTLKSKIKKRLDLSDFAILFEKKRDTKFVEKELNKLNIKHTFYKKVGLYQSDEAKNIYFLLKALAKNLKEESILTALITDFFGVSLAKLIDKDLLIKRYWDTFAKWQEYAQKREYGRLFNKIIDDTGLFFKLRKGSSDWERAITNYNHVFQKLLTTKEISGYTIDDLARLLKNLIEKNITDDGVDSDLYRSETEDPKVKLLTIHASKGLEFPIVFVFGNFGEITPKKTTYYKFYKDDKICYDLSKDSENEMLAKDYNIFEQKRLYYVAITRAIFKLYIPIKKNKKEDESVEDKPVKDKKDKENKKSEDNFLIKSLLKLEGGDIKFESCDLNKKDKNSGDENNDSQEVNNTQKEIDREDVDKNEPTYIIDCKLPTYDENIRYRKTILHSFSSINKSIKKDIDPHSIKIDKESRSQSEGTDENDNLHKEDDNSNSNIEDTLPGGAIMGDIFHKILESVDFKEFANLKEDAKIKEGSEIDNIISDAIQKYPLGYTKYNRDEVKVNDLKKIIFKMLINTLNAKLDETSFKLSDLSKSDRLNEVEFYYPFPKADDHSTSVSSTSQSPIGDTKFSDGFIHGYIDMIFKKDEKYYLLDWKSSRYEHYHGEEFTNKVKEQYGMQYKLYSIALIRYLKDRITNFDYDKHFGGVYYIYIRGMNLNDNNLSGVFFEREEKNPEENYEKELNNLLSTHW